MMIWGDGCICSEQHEWCVSVLTRELYMYVWVGMWVRVIYIYIYIYYILYIYSVIR